MSAGFRYESGKSIVATVTRVGLLVHCYSMVNTVWLINYHIIFIFQICRGIRHFRDPLNTGQ